MGSFVMGSFVLWAVLGSEWSQNNLEQYKVALE